MQEYIPSRKAAKTLNVHPNTLRNWAASGKIEHIVTESGQRRYNISSFIKLTNKKKFCYCRVSSKKQSADLERQAKKLQEAYPNHILIKDVGSGINFKRKGIQTILDSAMRGNIEELVVTHKDRLSRISFELIELIIQKNGGNIVVLDEKHDKSYEQELSEELLSIIHVYSSRHYGKRRGKRNVKNEENKDLPNVPAEENNQPVVRNE